jgi:hypothetical protein
MTASDPEQKISDCEKKRVEFDLPIPAKVMSIDGTWSCDALLIAISDTEGEIEARGKAAELAEFFLLLTSFGNPVFRRCKRKWVRGPLIGVNFNNSKIGIKSLEDEIRKEEELEPVADAA